MTRSCAQCGEPITRHSKTGFCRLCCLKRINADSVIAEKRRDRLAEVVQREGYKARHLAGAKRGGAKRAANPVQYAKLQEIGRTYGRKNLENGQMPEARAKAGAALRRQRLSWCPMELWPLNDELARKHIPLVERKAIIAEEVERAARKAAAHKPVSKPDFMSFEEQMERVRNGAKLTTVPDTRPTGPAYSLVGNATGML
jgi:hypothetical protein